jgi:sodium-independent sulfate anion transporter 11
VDASQEMIALGLCNFFGSFVSSMPTTGSFSRTAVNSASGVQTPFGGVYTGALVLLALGVLMPACAYIPKATLAAVIITAVIFSVEYHLIVPMWKSKSKMVVFVCFHCEVAIVPSANHLLY